MSRRIIVAGAVANKHGSGGEAWVRMSWVKGFQRLGYDVEFVEEIRSSACVDERGAPTDPERSANYRYFERVCELFDLNGRATLVVDDGARTFGHPFDDLADRMREAEVLVNISGHLRNAALFGAAHLTALVDIDPGFTQIWHEEGTAEIEAHDRYFTIGENIGTTESTIPTCGLRWLATRQPVVLADWEMSSADAFDRFTTIANWRGPYGPLAHAGRTLGLKVHEFRKVIELPRSVDACFELALNIHPADSTDRSALARNGWRIVDPIAYCSDPAAFREYVRGSSAEFSVAQGVYVDTNSGWFSDRSVRYLASGLPVLVQETGFSRCLPSTEGIVAFRTPEDAVAGARDILERYDDHRRAARAAAEEHFDSDRVLTRFLEMAGE
jgi:hypothetical protein